MMTRHYPVAMNSESRLGSEIWLEGILVKDEPVAETRLTPIASLALWAKLLQIHWNSSVG